MLPLHQFVERLRSIDAEDGIDDILHLLSTFEQVDTSAFEQCMTNEAGGPQTTTLYLSEQIKLILIYWEGLKSSTVHGHPGGGGLVKVLSGRLRETRFDPDDPSLEIDSGVLEEGSLGYVHDVLAWHKVENADTTPAVSLHIYSLKRSA